MENELYWVPDMAFSEDSNRTAAGHAGTNLGLTRRIAVSLLRQDPGKGDIKAKRLNTALNENLYAAAATGIYYKFRCVDLALPLAVESFFVLSTQSSAPPLTKIVRLVGGPPPFGGASAMLEIILVLASTLQVQVSAPKSPADSGDSRAHQREEKSGIVASTPEQALRIFFIAMILKDEATLRSVTLPTKDFDLLLKGERPPSDQLKEIKEQIAKQPIRELKAGDEITLPGNRKVKVKEEEVTADRAVLLPEGSPIPTRVRKVEKRWRVDATAIIAGRKAAEAARKKAEQPKP